ncbi:MAG: hypothetical protein A3K68_01625 [Euryarchaeota archaeon RBG_16_68_13]|nr:MAG: hypothetical protein A3K68_01625 [Euryarchaeota archaeon RBG_16_68_13]
MRVALKIAYEGRAFFGHQRQPDARTVEGECLRALEAAGILRDPKEAFFRSASRTDRGVSALGNVIAFDSRLRPEAVVGAFNDRARDVWAWAIATVPPTFHPRHAVDRWYRYHLPGDVPLEPLRNAANLFEGEHDFRSFTSNPPTRPMTIDAVAVARDQGMVLVDVRAQSFRRGMVRRIVSAMVACAEGRTSPGEIADSLRGHRRDFGMARPEGLVLMDVHYEFPFQVVSTGKARDEWHATSWDAQLRVRFGTAVLKILESGRGIQQSNPDGPVHHRSS